jgi:uncharacterized repeat protein (TIGR04076 family)
MFKVKATVIAFLGDTQKYPCHFNYQIGEEIIWTGGVFQGRICPSILIPLSQKVDAMFKAGPRYIENNYYYPFYYAPISEYAPENKKYDGIGFKNVLKTPDEPQYHMANLKPANAYQWPPYPERTVNKESIVQCGDLRTIATLKLEAFDLADGGYCVTFFRRSMMILAKVAGRPGVAPDQLLTLYTREEIENIYPALSPMLVNILCEEMMLLGYLEALENRLQVTTRGRVKLQSFIDSLPAEDKNALNL